MASIGKWCVQTEIKCFIHFGYSGCSDIYLFVGAPGFFLSLGQKQNFFLTSDKEVAGMGQILLVQWYHNGTNAEKDRKKGMEGVVTPGQGQHDATSALYVCV